ncbi:MAG: tRNA (guanosine(37)-N1)-methyltransferase TrmD [Chloroflexi bacterium]|nr:tRNA (guanosine(37)-N1)-methyltransferase TrmD [Chloroflexota bacterium]
MDITFLTLNPESIEPLFSQGVIGRARLSGILNIQAVNIRDYATDKHHTVDDTPYGGGSGMLLKVDIVYTAVSGIKQKAAIKNLKPYVVLTSPGGKVFHQQKACELSQKESLIFVCGQYEGIDARLNDLCIDEEISIGDFVLSGGEMAAAAMANAICRLLPGVLGDEVSAIEDSHSTSLLEYPQYTRPSDFLGQKVPSVLLSGDHARIELWRWQQSFLKTLQIRPELLKNYDFTGLDKKQKKFVDDLHKQQLL